MHLWTTKSPSSRQVQVKCIFVLCRGTQTAAVETQDYRLGSTQRVGQGFFLENPFGRFPVRSFLVYPTETDSKKINCLCDSLSPNH